MMFVAGGVEVGFLSGTGLLFGVVCALLAESRGRSALAWFFIGLFLSCVGFVILLVLPNLAEESAQQRQQRLEEENRQLREQLRTLAEKDPQMERALWYYLDGEEQVGPLSLGELRRRWREGRLGGATYVWGEGMEDWRMLRDLPDLEERFRA